MSMTDRDHPELEDLFATARTDCAWTPDRLMARVMADAEAVLQARAVSVARPGAMRSGVLPQLMQALGGWGGIGGLLTASFAGLWLGLAGVAGDFGLGSGTSSTAPDLAPDAYAMLAVEE